MTRSGVTGAASRRQVIGALTALVTGTAIGGGASTEETAQAGLSSPPVPRADLVNTLEFEAQARAALTPEAFAPIAGSDRSAFDRITLRPRVMVPTTDLDLSLTLFGDTWFAPIAVGPVNHQRRFHSDGELATVKGASAASAVTIVSSHTNVPLDTLTAAATMPLWAQVFASDPGAAQHAVNAVAAGCQAICVTIGVAPPVEGARRTATPSAIDWTTVASVRRSVKVPVLVKGVTTPALARAALRYDMQGLVVSNYGGPSSAQPGAPLLTLPNILTAVNGRVPVLIDGSFRRGTDIIKALAFGVRAVIVSRPVMWGLATYGADGVQGVIEMLQTELARYMCMCGRARLTDLEPSMVRVHAERPARQVSRE